MCHIPLIEQKEDFLHLLWPGETSDHSSPPAVTGIIDVLESEEFENCLLHPSSPSPAQLRLSHIAIVPFFPF